MISVKNILAVKGLSIVRQDTIILNQISFELGKESHLAILGNTGSGKTTLAKALSNKIFFNGSVVFANEVSGNIVLVEQQHHFRNRQNTSDLYYQQRYNSFDSEETITVKEVLGDSKEVPEMLHKMNIYHLLEKPLIQLSNGENKKLQIVKALIHHPTTLILDQPFIGLDVNTREEVHHFINALAKEGILIILITSHREIPDCITHILSLEAGSIKYFLPKQEYFKMDLIQPISNKAMGYAPPFQLNDDRSIDFKIAIRLEDVNISYGSTKILKSINWEVKRGECWLLQGENGAGKSTLLSLLTGDNPQAYANNIVLFDKPRGSGESIWDIKKNIGYLSPELHVFFEKDITVIQALGSGFFDSIGLFRKLSLKQREAIDEWIHFIELTTICEKKFYELSIGQQRMVLLVRALIKNPPLLILDEPCQGIDESTKTKMIRLVDYLCKSDNKTLIYVTHVDRERPTCIDHIMKLKDGKGITSEILAP